MLCVLTRNLNDPNRDQEFIFPIHAFYHTTMVSRDLAIWMLPGSFALPQLCNSEFPNIRNIKHAAVYNPPNIINT